MSLTARKNYTALCIVTSLSDTILNKIAREFRKRVLMNQIAAVCNFIYKIRTNLFNICSKEFNTLHTVIIFNVNYKKSSVVLHKGSVLPG
jgi:hypothetical protein